MKKFKTYDEFLIENYYGEIFEEDDDGKKELSDKQKRYQDLMLFGLAKYGAESPGDLSKDDKTEFFNWLKDNWNKDTGNFKDPKIADKIKKAKENDLIKQNPATLSDEEKEKQKEEKAKEKREEFKKLMDEE
jgi:hypothetical protein